MKSYDPKLVHECERGLFESGNQENYSIWVMTYSYGHDKIYDPEWLAAYRRSVKAKQEAEAEAKRKMDLYNESIDWAREHGANIRKGRITKDLSRYRIFSAGLMDEYNSRFPDFAFTEEDVRRGVERLEERDREYEMRKKPKKKPKTKYPMPEGEGE